MLSCICGYHIYHLIWDWCEGEMLHCESNRHNVQDRFTVSVKQDHTITGHLPWKISQICTLLRQGGSSYTLCEIILFMKVLLVNGQQNVKIANVFLFQFYTVHMLIMIIQTHTHVYLHNINCFKYTTVPTYRHVMLHENSWPRNLVKVGR